MKINKDSTLVHKSLSTKMGALDTIEVVARRAGASYCNVNGVQVDITNAPGITALIFTENAAGGLDLTTRVRYNTMQNPQAGQPHPSLPVSLYNLLRGLANNQVFVLYTYLINTRPSVYDLTRLPDTYAVNVYRSTIDINYLFAAIGSYKWNTIQRIANNGREYTPYCCIGRVVHRSHVSDPYSFRAQVTHEALGNIRGQNIDAVLKVNIPKFFTKNTIDYSQYYNLNVIGDPDSGNTTIYGPIPPEKTYPTAVQVQSHSGVKVTMDVGYYSTGATYHGSTNNSEITINIVNPSGTVLVTKKVYGYIPQKVTIDIPPNTRNANGDLRVVVTRNHSAGEVGLRSYVNNISYAKYAAAPNGTNEVNNVLVDKRVIAVKSVNASNIGIDMVDTAHFNALQTVGNSTLYNYTTSRWLGNSTIPTFLINNTTTTYTSSEVDIDSSCNYVYHMLTTPNAFNLYIDTLDANGNLVAGLSHNGGATTTTATITYNASSQSILGKALYCHQFVNIPIFGVGADTSTKTYKGPLVEKLPSNGVKQYIQFNQFAKKIRVRIRSTQAGNMVFHAKLLPMIVGLRNDGVLFSNIKNA